MQSSNTNKTKHQVTTTGKVIINYSPDNAVSYPSSVAVRTNLVSVSDYQYILCNRFYPDPWIRSQACSNTLSPYPTHNQTGTKSSPSKGRGSSHLLMCLSLCKTAPRPVWAMTLTLTTCLLEKKKYCKQEKAATSSSMTFSSKWGEPGKR